MSATTKEHFALFSETVKECQRKFGLLDWDIQLRHMSIGTTELAQANLNCEGCVATVTLNKSWKEIDPITSERIKRVAIHEVLHVLLGNLSYIASCRYITQSELDEAEHKVVRRIENLILDDERL